MENKEIEAQGMLIRDNPFQRVGLGNDSTINWMASDGNPTLVAGASIGSDAAYVDNNFGVRLTPASDNKVGYLYWQKSYDLNNSMIINTVLRSGGGDGADGFTIFYGGDGGSSGSSDEGGISIYLDEYNSDVIKIYKAGVLVDEFGASETLDSNNFNAWTIVHEHVGTDYIYLHVLMNGKYVCKINLAPWTKAGDYIGVSGVCGSANNEHWVRAFQVKNAAAWLAANKY
jgi:hypothetical protein